MNFVGVVHEYIQMYELDGNFLFSLPNPESQKLNLITESILERKMLALTMTLRNKINKEINSYKIKYKRDQQLEKLLE